MSEMSCDECPVRTGKKTCGEKMGIAIPARVCDVEVAEGGAAHAHLAISYFNGTV